jgi:Uma2 family endonuclease
MPLALFDRAEPVNGHTYELSRGIIQVSDIPDRIHPLAQQLIRNLFVAYQLKHPRIIAYQGSGAEQKLLIRSFESERHPDWAVYLTPMPELDQPWSVWVPQLVVEIVSETSIRRDYEEKPPEYLALGVQQCWIVDPIRKSLLIKTNKGGLWSDKTFSPRQKITTHLLPGFVFDLKRVLKAAS